MGQEQGVIVAQKADTFAEYVFCVDEYNAAVTAASAKIERMSEAAFNTFKCLDTLKNESAQEWESVTAFLNGLDLSGQGVGEGLEIGDGVGLSEGVLAQSLDEDGDVGGDAGLVDAGRDDVGENVGENVALDLDQGGDLDGYGIHGVGPSYNAKYPMDAAPAGDLQVNS